MKTILLCTAALLMMLTHDMALNGRAQIRELGRDGRLRNKLMFQLQRELIRQHGPRVEIPTTRPEIRGMSL